MAKNISIVVPMYNSEKHIVRVLEALLAQEYQGEVEIIVVNDGSTDRSRELTRPFEERGLIRVVDQENQGAAAATNSGIRVAKHEIICSIDSDVVLEKEFLSKVAGEFEDPQVAAVQGYYKTPKGSSFLARMMGYDIEKRYDDIKDRSVSQVCTGDTAYRRSALEKVGLFDTSFSYGYDNDMSYRLQNAGYRLVFRKDAVCLHYWKTDLKGYIRQQYRSAYGRMQLVRKHGDRTTGDSVSGLRMILQVPATLLAVAFSAAAGIQWLAGHRPLLAWPGLFCLAAIGADRFGFAVSVVRSRRDITALLMPCIHLLRNLVWCWALVRWTVAGIKGS